MGSDWGKGKGRGIEGVGRDRWSPGGIFQIDIQPESCLINIGKEDEESTCKTSCMPDDGEPNNDKTEETDKTERNPEDLDLQINLDDLQMEERILWPWHFQCCTPCCV